MRVFCTVSAPLEVCAPPTRPLSPGSRFLALRLLGTPQPRTLYFLVEAKSRVREVYAQTCLHFAKQGMLDTELFGLAVLLDGEYMFADPESKLSKYGPKSWRSSHTHGLDANGRPLLELYFRVQFYIESPFMLRDETSRHNYFLQLKANTISRDIPKEYSEQSMVFLGGLALQADLGDCPDIDDVTIEASSSGLLGVTKTTLALSSELSSKASSVTSLTTNSTSALQSTIREYFRFEEYIPSTIRSSWGATALRTCHRENRGMARSDAELTYIKHACALHDAINAHVFRMKMSKNDSGVGSGWFIIYAKGIKIYSENTQPIIFLWPNIIKLSFERKKFEIRSGDNKITLYSTSDEKNKMLLTLCKETHQFSMKIASRLKEAIKREEDENNSLHACYIYSKSFNLPYKNKNDQRISVISSTSSNTTSGIVSDRVHSEDELEIMINTPPAVPIAAPSTESLALAHLLDTRLDVSRQTSSVGQVSLKDLEDHLAALSVRTNITSISSDSMAEHNTNSNTINNNIDRSCTGELKEIDAMNSQYNVGSQCSSTCSTVVVATDTITLSSLAAHTTPIRRPSTSSSLELGFSHTAQNSALSDDASTCIDQDYISNNDGENESVSGVYTLAHAPPTETSGVYTMNSSELTGQSSEIAESESHDSSHYGSFQPKSEIDDESVENIDSVDGQYQNRMDKSNMTEFRMRSDSNVSASGSFRGDGSDPTDMKHALLSAEELTDLIVGRETYPSRETISKTLDSDSDYLTLPLPLEGDSYLQCHEDIPPIDNSDDIDNILQSNLPVPPNRIDSHTHRFLSSLVDIQMRSPPPYNARHEKTGLCGPPVHKELKAPIPFRDPPPYTQQLVRLSNQQNPVAHCMIPEEVTARFITTRPQISILKAHTSVVSENAKPSYAAPTITAISAKPHPSIPSTIGIPVVPYNLHTGHKSMSSIPPPPSPYADVKPPTRTCVLLPVIKPRQYLPPPPPTLPRQPPPPPPSQLATVYTGQLARSQIELYQQQLYSDVDYVIYPLQDPAVSQQDYLDAKQGPILATMAQSSPPPPYLTYHTTPHTNTWDTCKGHAIYRSTPYLPMALTAHSRYASTQNLSDTYVQLSGTYSPLYSPSVASLCSSYEPPPPPLRPAAMGSAAVSMQPQQFQTLFARSRSDGNILNSVESIPKMKRQPPPPPPQSQLIKKPPMPAPQQQAPPIPLKPMIQQHTSLSRMQHQQMTNISTILSQHRNHQIQTSLSNGGASNGAEMSNGVSSIDIQILREKSRNMDLPLISALCNDRSLLKQTKAFVMPKHPRGTSLKINNNIQLQSVASSIQTTKSKYPVSGLRTTQLTNPRKTSISHRHPNDKLPPLPVQTIEGNNYVSSSTRTPMKHTNFNSQVNS